MSIKAETRKILQELKPKYELAVKKCQKGLDELGVDEVCGDLLDELKQIGLFDKLISHAILNQTSDFDPEMREVRHSQGFRFEYHPFNNLTVDEVGAGLDEDSGRFKMHTEGLRPKYSTVRVAVGDVRSLEVSVVAKVENIMKESVPEFFLIVASTSTSDIYICTGIKISDKTDLERTLAEIWGFGIQDPGRALSVTPRARGSLERFLIETTNRRWRPTRRAREIFDIK